MNKIDEAIREMRVIHNGFYIKEVSQENVKYAAEDKISWDIHHLVLYARIRTDNIVQPFNSSVVNELFKCHGGNPR